MLFSKKGTQHHYHYHHHSSNTSWPTEHLVYIKNWLLCTYIFKIFTTALAGVAQWIERHPANQRVTGLIPSVGHMPGL